ASEGLSSETVWTVRRQVGGRLWVGTNRGVDVFNPDDTPAHVWRGRDGLLGERARALAAGPGGEIWVGTTPGGITEFDARGRLVRTYGLSSGLTSDRIWGLV